MSLERPSVDREARRLDELRSYRLRGSASNAAFDHIVRLAAGLFEVPTALVSFVEDERQFFRGRIGFDACETARDGAFCAHTIAGEEVLVVPDARDDPRFRDSPLVTGEVAAIRFYAGAPIVTPRGHRLGAVCVMDAAPRPPLTERERELLRGLARIAMDHLERRKLDIVRRAALRMAAATPDAIICSDDAGLITFWNDAAGRIFGYARGEVMGRPLSLLVPPDRVARHRARMAELLGAERPSAQARMLETRGLHRDGTQMPIEISVATWREEGRTHVGTVVRDLSEREHARERAHRLARFDGLTGLPNRAQFLERIDSALADAGRFAVLQIGLDRFKAVNGAMGMAAGDRLLVAAAERVRDAAGSAALVARLGADEFGVLVEGSDDPVGSASLAQRVMARLGEPFDLGASICHLGASVGLALCPGPSDPGSADGVLRRALLALQRAKAAGGARLEVFRPQLGEDAEERRRVEEGLRNALARGEFELHFQPQVSLPGGGLLGAEALLRWRHPERGLLAPASFLPALEASEAAVPVGRWIIREACAFAADMRARGAPMQVGINLFAAQLRHPALADEVAAALAASGLPGRCLEIEITETTVLGLDEGAIAPLRRLRELGVGIAFDDYGTGFASLSLLKRYPLTRLKIDREFVRDLHSDPDDAAIVKAVIALGASLGLGVIAEGIETPEQASALAGFGCREAQGYLFGRPVPAADFAARHAPAARSVA